MRGRDFGSIVMGLMVLAGMLAFADPPPDDLLAGPEFETTDAQPGDTATPDVSREMTIEERIEQDVVLQTIRAVVEPSAMQWGEILQLYQQFRREQRQVFTGVRDRMEQAADEDRAAQRRLRREIMRETREVLNTINAEFLASCKALMAPTQDDAWEECAAQLELMPARLRRDRDRASRVDQAPMAGETAPDFTLTTLNGEAVTLSALRGRTVVLEFGSYTCPIFRGKVRDFDALRAERTDVEWLLIYTREAHPSNGNISRRNVREGIEIPRHRTMVDRQQVARECADALDLSMRIVVDDMRNQVARRYDGAPNRCFVINADGVIVSKQIWSDPARTGAVLDELAAAAPAATQPATQPSSQPTR
ncbi:MAG: deiodinase-like protein [Planctomycetota bacterium]